MIEIRTDRREIEARVSPDGTIISIAVIEDKNVKNRIVLRSEEFAYICQEAFSQLRFRFDTSSWKGIQAKL